MKRFLPIIFLILTQTSFKAQVVWSNDCDNASEWTFSNTSSPSLDWIVTTSVNAAPLAAYQPLGFTSVANGFFIIDSEAAGASATQNARIAIATPIDLSANDHVKLSFENAAQSFTDKRTIEVSGDNGLTWTEYVVSSDTNHILYATENPSTFTIDISDVAGGQPQVLIAFIYEGGNDHFWAIDDVQIFVKEANDLQLDQIYFGQTGVLGVPLSYYSIWASAPFNNNISFAAIVSNQGSNPITNIIAYLDINDGLIRDTNMLSNLLPGAIDTIWFDSTITPNSQLDFKVKLISDSSENVINNNQDSVKLYENYSDEVTRSKSVLNNGIYNYGEEFQTGLIYDNIGGSGTVTSITVRLNKLSKPNRILYGIIYQFDTIAKEFVYIESTEEITVPQSGIDNESLIYLNLPSYVSFNSSTVYLITVGSYGDAGMSQDLIIAADEFCEKNTAFLWGFGESPDSSTYIVYKPAIGLDYFFGSVEENFSITSISNFPNPLSSSTTIEFETSQSEEFILEITDIHGRQVHTQNLGKRNTGKHLIEFDASQLLSGTYIYSIGNEKGKASKSMMVLK